MDTRTIFQISSVLTGSIFAYLVLIHITNTALRGLRSICYGFACACVGLQLVAFRGHSPAFISVILGQVFLVLINVFFYKGLVDLFRLRRSHGWLATLSLVPVVSVSLYCTYVHPALLPQIVTYSAVLALQNAVLAMLVQSNGSQNTRLPRLSISVLFALWSAGNLLRLGLAFFQQQPSVFPTASALNSMVVLIPVLSSTLLGIAFLWLSMSKQQLDLEQQSRTDVLTGLPNRRALEVTATREIARARRSGSALSTILFDIDEFKSINDKYGHEAGDFALAITANHVSETLRGVDLVARLGGDEFVILLPDTAGPVASEIAERLRRDLNNFPIRYNNQEFRLSASMGVTQLGQQDQGWDEMFRRADQALYQAKAAGRNRTVAA